jgi:hypothetical protein
VRPGDVLVDPADAVEQRVFGVEMQMRELGQGSTLSIWAGRRLNE